MRFGTGEQGRSLVDLIEGIARGFVFGLEDGRLAVGAEIAFARANEIGSHLLDVDKAFAFSLFP